MLQLTFAIKLWTHIKSKAIRKDSFDTEIDFVGIKLFPKDTLHTQDDFVNAAQNNYVINFGFTTLVLDEAMTDAGVEGNLPVSSPNRDLRALVRMMRCTFAHNMVLPQWKVRPPFDRVLKIKLPSREILLDMKDLDGEVFLDEQIGGMSAYFEIVEEVKRLVSIRQGGIPVPKVPPVNDPSEAV